MPGPTPGAAALAASSTGDQPFKETILQLLSNQHSLMTRMAEQMRSNITEFAYDLEKGSSFDAWFSRYADLFEKDASKLDDDAKYDCCFTAKDENEDFISYSCKVNRACVDFKLQELKEDQFKCLIFVCGLRSPKDADIRMRLLSKINETQDITLEKVVEECKSLINLKKDTVLIGSKSSPTAGAAATHAVRANSPNGNRHKKEKFGGKKSDTPKTPCWSCGGMHFSSQCTFKNHRCHECGRTGHKDGYCSCFASKSGSRRKQQNNKKYASKIVTVKNVNRSRRYVETAINGVPVELQLDSGSDITIISKQNWINVGAPQTSPPNCKVQTASGQKLGIAAMFRASYTINGTQKEGSDLMDEFGLWDVPFSSFCKLVNSPQPDQQVLELKEVSRRVYQPRTLSRYSNPSGQYPYNMEAIVEDELKRLEDSGIITPVTYADWAAQLLWSANRIDPFAFVRIFPPD
ncbi:uncharacterized protein LOC134222206 [Armigeres subalbatus]|uniref:uncharacterized protein LOC134222206 n=1 Tax=Armigeres subalbatus TaxID=124917 RepID=UPI002ED4339E